MLTSIGYEITDIYLFDHGNTSGIQLGDEFYGTGNGGLRDLAQLLSGTVETGTKIHFRSCNAGYFVEKSAAWSGLEADGCRGKIDSSFTPYWSPKEETVPGPDYGFLGPLAVATPVNNGPVEVYEISDYSGY